VLAGRGRALVGRALIGRSLIGLVVGRLVFGPSSFGPSLSGRRAFGRSVFGPRAFGSHLVGRALSGHTDPPGPASVGVDQVAPEGWADHCTPGHPLLGAAAEPCTAMLHTGAVRTLDDGVGSGTLVTRRGRVSGVTDGTDPASTAAGTAPRGASP
jgi:hypothetical protein